MGLTKTPLILLLATLLQIVWISPTSTVKVPKLIWSERFDVFDLRVWKHVVTASDGGNAEFQYYRNNRKNSYVKDGMLHIRATPVAEEVSRATLYNGSISEDDCNQEPCISTAGEDLVQPYYSARVRTKGTFSFKYGCIEFRAKMPRGDWLWPALWMMPETDKYGGWPRSGEIDIAEVRGNKDYYDQNGQTQGLNKVGSTMHFGPDPSHNRYDITNWGRVLQTGDLSDDFHLYTMTWTNTSITFRLDGEITGEVKVPPGGFWELGGFKNVEGVQNPWKRATRMAPFDQPFHIIINLAVGGRFFGDGWKGKNSEERPWDWSKGAAKKQFWENRKKFLSTWDRPEFLIDHILVYGYD